VVGVPEPENVARELDDRVLEATSGADERNTALARVANGRERAVHAPVGTGRRDPKPSVPGEQLVGLASDRLRRNPLEAEPDVIQGIVGERVGGILSD